ncbi:MAG: chemotaxis protein methyltransferase CheR [Desulfobacteraceae bacterium Eth-SRB2]|nr:MAG: chemotaxis protein methyltransferase CheR [Desulfobacteraceae bacterium Eth-SRB2]
MKQLTKRQFKRYCDIVYNESGIKLNEDKWQLLNARIGKRIRKLGVQADKYLSIIEKDHDELNLFLDAISTNHTYFFRESKSFEFLDTSCRNIWCAASSSGEEPYSLATYCLELGFEPSILATDISDSCLDKGRRAIYPKKCLSNIPKHMIRRYFQKGTGKWEDHVRVKQNIRRIVKFEKFNLLKDSPPSKIFDIIFCRNVMIYFDIPTKEAVIRKLFKVLKQDGYFIIGGAESLSGLNHSLKYIEPSIYRKI